MPAACVRRMHRLAPAQPDTRGCQPWLYIKLLHVVVKAMMRIN